MVVKRHSTVSARRMSYELIYALCITHRSFRDTLLELGALSRIRATADEVRFFAFEETHLPWDTLAPISQSAMRGLQEDPLLTASALPLVASDIHKFMRLPEFRNGVLQLVSNTRCVPTCAFRMWRLAYNKPLGRAQLHWIHYALECSEPDCIITTRYAASR